MLVSSPSLITFVKVSDTAELLMELFPPPKSGRAAETGRLVNPDGRKELFLSTLARSPCSMNSKRSQGESASVFVAHNQNSKKMIKEDEISLLKFFTEKMSGMLFCFFSRITKA